MKYFPQFASYNPACLVTELKCWTSRANSTRSTWQCPRHTLYTRWESLSKHQKPQAMQPYAGYLPEESIWGKSKGTLLRFFISGFSISRTHRSNRFIKSHQKLIRGWFNPLWVSGHILAPVLGFMFFVVWIRTENTPHKQLGPLRYRRFTPILLVP